MRYDDMRQRNVPAVSPKNEARGELSTRLSFRETSVIKEEKTADELLGQKVVCV